MIDSTTPSDLDITGLQRLGAQIRLTMIGLHSRVGFGHLGSSLSVAEILAVIFGRFFRWPESDVSPFAGDRFVLSKGHAALGLYCALACVGRITGERLSTFGCNGGPLEAHPNERLEPTLHASTGSLGQGLSIAVGYALGSRLQGAADRTFALIGDGEANEGQIWEAARSAATLKLSNLIVVMDDNAMQQDGPTRDIMPVNDLVDSWTAIGWRCGEADGHSCESIAVGIAGLLADPSPVPKLLHARTIKGKGIPFLEGCTESHYPPPLSLADYALVKYMLEAEVQLC